MVRAMLKIVLTVGDQESAPWASGSDIHPVIAKVVQGKVQVASDERYISARTAPPELIGL